MAPSNIDSLSSLLEPTYVTLLETAVKGSALLVAAALASIALQGASAARRHLLWSCALTALLVLPALTAVLPRWQIEAPALAWLAPQPAAEMPTASDLDASDEANAAHMPRTDATTVGSGSARSCNTAAESCAKAAKPSGCEKHDSPCGKAAGLATMTSDADGGASGSGGGGTGAGSSSGGFGPVGSPHTPAQTAPAADHAVIPWRAILVGVWCLGALLVLVATLTSHLSLRNAVRAARPLRDPDWQAAALEAADRLRLTQPYALLLSAACSTPLAFGLLRARVLLPAGAEAWPAERRRSVLLHELAHIKRHDCLTQALAQLACVLLWFHPGVWWAAARMRLERERACDDAVIAAKTPATAYADHLLEVVRAVQFRRLSAAGALGAVAFARPSQFEGRLLAVLDPQRDRREVSMHTALRGATLALVLALPLAALQPTGAAARSSTTSTKHGQTTATSTQTSTAPKSSPATTSETTSKPTRSSATSSIASSRSADRAQPSYVARAPEGAALDASIAWSASDARRRDESLWWIGWQLDPPADTGNGVLSDSEGLDVDALADDSGFLTLDDVLAGRTSSSWPKRASGKSGALAILLMLRAPDGDGAGADAAPRIVRTRVQSLRLPADCAAAPLYWLGPAADGESLRWIQAAAARERDPRLRSDLVEAVSFFGETSDVSPWLRACMGTAEPSAVRESAAEGLGRHPTAENVEFLAHAARTDRDSDVRRAATEALGQARTPEAMDALLALAGDPGTASDIRHEAFDSIGDAVAEGQMHEREELAVAASARAQHEAALHAESRTQALRSADLSIAAALEAQARLDAQRRAAAWGEATAAEQTAAEQAAAEQAAAEQLAEAGEAARDRAADESLVVAAERAAEVAGATADPRIVAALDAQRATEEAAGRAAALADGELEVQRQAVESLGRYPEREALPKLRAIANEHPNAMVRAQAVESIGRFGSKTSNAVIEEMVWKSPDAECRDRAVESMARTLPPDEALAKLERIARGHPAIGTRRMAVECLGRVDSPAVAECLQRFIRDESQPEVCRQAVESLGRLDADTLPQLAEIAQRHPLPEARRQAVESMVHRDPDRALPYLEKILQSGEPPVSGESVKSGKAANKTSDATKSGQAGQKPAHKKE